MTNWREKCAVVIWLAVLLCSAWFVVAHTKIQTDLTGFLPAAPTRAQQLLLNQLREGPASRLILMGIEGDTPDHLAILSQALTDGLKKDKNLSFIHNGDAEALLTERDLLMKYRYLLSPAMTTEHFQTEALKLALQANVQLLSSHGGTLAKSFIPSDPTGEVRRIFAFWAPANNVGMHNGVWFSENGKRALLIAQTYASGMDVNLQQEAISAIQRHFDIAKNALVTEKIATPSDARLLLSGTGIFAAESRRSIEKDSWRLTVIATVLVWLVLWIVYRSLSLTLLAFLPVASGLLIGVAAVAMIFGSVHGITLAFGATLIGEAVDYANYVLLHTKRGESVKSVLSRIGPTLQLAVLTTVFSSLALLMSSFSGLAQLGLLSLVGVLAAGLISQLVLPVLAGKKFGARKMERLPFGLSSMLMRLPHWRWVVPLFVIMAAGILFVRRNELWNDDLSSMSPVSTQAKQLDQELRNQLGAPDVRYILMATGKDREQARRQSELLQPVLMQLVQEGVIEGFDMAAHYLPSAQLQRQRQAVLPSDADLKNRLHQAMQDLPFRDDAFQPFLHDVTTARQQPLLTMHDLAESSLGIKVQSLMVSDKEGTAALITLRGVRDAIRLKQFLDQNAEKNIIAIDLKEDTGRLIASYRNESLRLSALGLGLIAILLLICLRSLQTTWKVLYPVIAGTVICAALLICLGQRWMLFHLVSLLLVIGIGLNYSLFLNRDDNNENASDSDSESGKQRNHLSLVTCSVTTFFSFGTLTLSAIPVLHAIGQTVALGSVLCLSCVYLLAKDATVSEE